VNAQVRAVGVEIYQFVQVNIYKKAFFRKRTKILQKNFFHKKFQANFAGFTRYKLIYKFLLRSNNRLIKIIANNYYWNIIFGGDDIGFKFEWLSNSGRKPTRSDICDTWRRTTVANIGVGS